MSKAEPRRFSMGTRSKSGQASPQNLTPKKNELPRISPRKRSPLVGVGATCSSNVEKAKDGSLIYKRRSSAGMVAPAPEKEAPVTTTRKRYADRDKDSSASSSPLPKRRRTIHKNSNGDMIESDAYCWICHKDGGLTACCEICPRMYHVKCLAVNEVAKGWACSECEKIMKAECVDTRSKAMAMITVDQLCALLRYALQRMKHSESEPFQKPVDPSAVAHYTDLVFHPMDLATLEKNIRKKLYGSTEAFLADAKWIFHNSIVFNGPQHKLSASARMIIKIVKFEMNEIEICPDCYVNSCTQQKEDWFCEPCRTPHPLVWAKMKGYPFWPAKALREVGGQVDCRFFGEHDRAWVPVSQVFLLSKEAPTNIRKGTTGFHKSMDELKMHIDKIREKFGGFEYAPYRTPYDSQNTYNHPNFKIDGTPEKTPEKQKKTSPLKRASEVKKNLSSKLSERATSVVSKAASALKSKYSSIISTRRGLMLKNAAKDKKEQEESLEDQEEIEVEDTAANEMIEEEMEVDTKKKKVPTATLR